MRVVDRRFTANLLLPRNVVKTISLTTFGLKQLKQKD